MSIYKKNLAGVFFELSSGQISGVLKRLHIKI
jgi:hypothetical protein